MWSLFWIETSRQFHEEELTKVPDGMSESDIKIYVEEWCESVFDLWNATDSHVFFGHINLSDLIGSDYAPTPKGLREWLVNLLAQNAHFEVWQERPYTAVSVITRLKETYQRIGFSKAHWPDEWDAQHGIDLAVNKAISKIAKEILSNRLSEVREYFEEMNSAS